MYTTKEKNELRKLLQTIEKCNGNCKECKQLDFVSSSYEHYTYFAFGCKKAPNFSPIANSAKSVKPELLETLKFELS